MKTLSALAPQVRSLLRIVVGFTFSLHGLQKLLGLFGGTKAGMLSLMWAVGCLEAVGGLLILLGLFTRPVAFLLCGQMAVAYLPGIIPVVFGPSATVASLPCCTASSSSISSMQAPGR